MWIFYLNPESVSLFVCGLTQIISLTHTHSKSAIKKELACHYLCDFFFFVSLAVGPEDINTLC